MSTAIFQQCVQLSDQLAAAGRVGAAEKLLQSAAKLFPRSGVFHSKLAAIAAWRNDLVSLLAHLDAQTRAEPNDADAWLSLCVFSLLAPNLEEAQRRLAFTTEAYRLIELRADAGVQGAHDIRQHIARAALEGVLSPGDLLEVLATIQSAIHVARLTEKLDPESFPLLHTLGAAKVRFETTVGGSGLR